MLKKKLEGSVDKEQSEREVVVKRTEVMSLKINSATCAINETEVEVLEESEREVVVQRKVRERERDPEILVQRKVRERS